MYPSSGFISCRSGFPLHILLISFLLHFGESEEHEKDSGLWFSHEPTDKIVVPGRGVILDCKAVSSDSKAHPIISWRNADGNILNLAGDPNRSQLVRGALNISRVTNESGTEQYACMASVESIGKIVSRVAAVTTAKLPALLREPQSLHVYPGQTAYFVCDSDGRPTPNITWLKDQQPLVIDEARMVVLPSGSLEIDDVQISDTGAYRCNLTALNMHRLSKVAYLTVSQDLEGANRETPPEFVATPQSSIALEGDTVTLDCAANSNPKPWITWLKDGVTLDMADLDSRYVKVGTGSLQISSVIESDAGDYQCRADNREDSADAQATLHIHVAPRFVKKPVSKVAIVKSDIELECEVYAKPEPKVIWFKNGDIISPNNDYLQVVNGNNLRILGVMELDYGIFQCVASNPAGNIQAAALLTVKHPVTNMRWPLLQRVTEPGKSETGAPRDLEAAVVKPKFVTLRWKPPATSHGEILAYSVFYVEKHSDRERVLNTSRSRLEEANIAGLRPNTTYSFRVAALTESGVGASSDPLVVVTRPELRVPSAPQNVKAIPSTTHLIVTWIPPSITNGRIHIYKLYYYESETSEEHHIETVDTGYTVTGLKKFTEYIVWVVAYNHNGAGHNSEEITVKTLSDIPSEPPTNVTVEASSSSSVIVRWEPPPLEGRNGVITGYKLRYRMRDRRGRSETVTTAGDRRLWVLNGLENSSVYQVRIWALNANGTGPPTDWHTIETYEKDLDESTVPGAPVGMRAKANGDSITVIWSPPKNPNIMVRDYIIGWGKGVPDDYAERLEGKLRFYVIKNLEPNSDYVISLKAHNERGDGPPVYENVRTRDETPTDTQTPLIPPVGLKATVISPTSVVLFWSDSTLPQDQVVTDNRYYVVRYNQFYHSAINTKYRFHNSTVLNYMIDDLKPFTQYEFVVKVVKGRRESPWSMMVVNTTWEAAPGSPPRDLTVVNVDNSPGTVSLSWQPPKIPNGLITNYIVSYTTDLQSKERDWITEIVQGDKMAATIKALSLSTTYYFHVKAKNKKGFSISSPVVSVTTLMGYGGIAEVGSLGKGKGGLSTTAILYIVIIASSLVITIISILLIIFCCRRSQATTPERNKKGYMKGKASTSNIKPPDLWIHHDQMELKNLEKNQEQQGSVSGGGGSTLPRGGASISQGDTPSRSGTMEKQRHPQEHRDYPSNYMGSQCQPLLLAEERTSTLRRAGIKQKPITLPIDNSHFREPVATATPVGVGTSLGTSSVAAGPSVGVVTPQSAASVATEARPLYPRTQYSISRAHVTIDPNVTENPYIVQPAPPGMSYEPMPSSAQQTPSNYGSGESAKRLQGHPLKSFSVPAPPPQSAPTTPQQKHIVTVRAQQGSSPYKKSGAYSGVTTSPIPGAKVKHTTEDLPKIQASYSTEELNQEMANLEGLMKDLNAITASEFQC
uniref:Putative neural cell adhesion molecule l1 n=1 Tax=Panstrongylus lignarius TaxID=156445 RepID=A0A224XGP9_9HEMI